MANRYATQHPCADVPTTRSPARSSTRCLRHSVAYDQYAYDESIYPGMNARSPLFALSFPDHGRRARCSDAGNWLFCGRKWIDPADPDGRAKLDLHHYNLSVLFPGFASACSLDRFIDAVAAVIDSWSRHAAATDFEESSPSADFGSDDAAESGGLPAQPAHAGDGEHSTVVSSAAAGPDHDNAMVWAGRDRPSVHADLSVAWPAVGLSSCALDSAGIAGKDPWVGWAECGINGGG